ncbi:MAG: mandelate racemase/muconate lactonizing enzyme family protein [Deltaproteobacteria bacterium]|nr:mandelate racemase/muconate lactonizing enzyme family protein [Deltaproteobacteria bacterium]
MSDPIEKIELFHLDIPLPEPFFPSWIPGYPQTANRSTLLRIESKNGLVGMSAGPAFEREREGLGDLLGPYLLGTDVNDVARATDLIRQAGFLGWHNAFLEGAFWDAKAKGEGLPVYKLLNREAATCNELKVYCSTGSLKTPEDRIKDLDAILAAGFGGIKLRVHSFDEKEDERLMRQVRDALDDDVQLMVDANQGWLVSILDPAPKWDLERAKRFCKVAEECNLSWVEEPLDRHDYDGLSELRACTKVPIAGAELNAGWHEFKILLERECFDIYQPDCTLAGGMSDCARLAKAATAKGKKFTPHTWTNGIGFLMNMHLKAAFPSDLLLEFPHEPPGWVAEHRDALLREPIKVKANGTVSVPQEPGLGIDLDEKCLRRYGSRLYVGSPMRIAMHTLKNNGIKNAFDLRKRKKAADEKHALADKTAI